MRLWLISASYFTSKCGAAALRRCFSSRLHSAAADAAWGCLYNGAHLAEGERHTYMHVRHLCLCLCGRVCIKSGALSGTHVTSPAVAVAVNVLAHPTGSRSRLFTPLHFTWPPCLLSLPFMPTQHIRFIYGVQISIGRPSRRASCVSLCASLAAAATVHVRVCGPRSLCPRSVNLFPISCEAALLRLVWKLWQ